MAKRNFCENCELIYLNAGPGQWCLACDEALEEEPPRQPVTIADEGLTVPSGVPTSTLTSEPRAALNLLIDEV